ncbi:MAG: ROK family protein [Gemmatimonadales bacterium]|jgi:fructokinase
MSGLVGAIEAGGTKFVCAVGTGPDDIRRETRFPTGDPGPTIDRAIEFFRTATAELEPLGAVGIGSFGPLDLRPDSPTRGSITATPKPNWSGTPFVDRVRGALDVPVAFDTDVNAAALGEWRWGAGQGLDAVAYVTVGTGIGGGVVYEGRPLHGMLHPELGHLPMPRDPDVDPFAGVCPFHGDCLEGLASGPALEARWGTPGTELPSDHPAWELEAEYLALGCLAIALTLAPQRIVLGGGVMEQRQLFPLVRRRFERALGGYLPGTPAADADTYLVPPGLGARAGLCGALALGLRAITTT